MEQEEDKQFQSPSNGGSAAGPNPPPAGPKHGGYQEATPKVDNFSPPQEPKGDSSGGSFDMPSDEEIKKPETPSQEQNTQSIKPEISEEEPEDVFAKKEETPPPPPSEPGNELKPKPETTPPPPPAEGQKLDIPEHKGYGYLWVILLLLIIVVLVEAIVINELGVGNLGLEKYYGAVHLEKLWGGLPAEAKPALGDSVKKMTGKSFKLDGSSQLSLSIESQGTSANLSESPSASPTASATPSSATDALGVETTGTGAVNIKSDMEKLMQDGLSFQNEVKINGSFQSPDKLEINLATDITDVSSSGLLGLIGAETMVDFSLINDGNDIYVKNNNLKTIFGTDKDWMKIIVENNGSAVSGSSVKMNNIVTSGERTGSTRVNGVNCYIYEVKLNGKELLGYLSQNNPNLAWLSSDISFQSMKVYLGKRDHLMHKIEVSTTHSPDVMTIKNKITLNLSDIGKQITITIPSSDMIVEKNWSDVRNTFVPGSATPTPTPSSTSTPQNRDMQRKADLKKIQDALLQYKVQNGKYPSTAAAIEKTKDATSNLKTALVPKYLTTLPVDPESDKYYYGYKSDDGTRCEIWSILEDSSDIDGEDYQGFWIYKLRGN